MPHAVMHRQPRLEAASRAHADADADTQALRDPHGHRRALAIVAAALVGALCSIVLWVVFTDADARLEAASFRERARDYQQTIGGALERVTDVVSIIRSFFETVPSQVTLAQYAVFARTVHQTLAVGLRETTWTPRVVDAQRDEFEQAMRARYFPQYQIRERDAAGHMVRAGRRAEYFPSAFVSPDEIGPQVLGFDVASEAVRRAALLRALATGEPAVTARVNLAVRHPGDQPGGFLIFAPVHGGSGFDPIALRGYVVGVLESDRLVEYMLADKPAEQDLDLYLFDPIEPPETRLIYWHSSRARPAPLPVPSEAALRARPHSEARLRVADREWGLLLAPPDLATGSGGRGLDALLLGAAVTLGAVGYLTSTLRHALRLEGLAAALRRTGAELRSKGAEIERLARHDVLTGLPNRITLQERLELAITRSRDGHGPCVMCLDLDRFKAVNDTFGHPVGDALLRLVAARLRGCLRAQDTVARIGGDEFVIVLDTTDRAGAESLAPRLVEQITDPFEIRGQQIAIGLSIGIATLPDGSADADMLMRNADFALYRAKQGGRGTWRSFEPEMETAAQARRAMEANLRQAVAEMSFTLQFQPVIRLSDRSICGVEALLRWDCPGIGAVSPAEFVPIAEDCGLIVPIGHWVLETACREAARWPATVRLAVNLSPAQFGSASLVASVEHALRGAGLAAARLELEITETLLLQDSRNVLATLRALKQLGVSIAMDDFGTGYSSLGYLQRFPFDTLKIDKSFVSDLPSRADSRAIVRAVTGLCRTLGIATVAEGVETDDQLRCAEVEGCDRVQGFLFSRPVPAGQVAALLTEDARVVAA